MGVSDEMTSSTGLKKAILFTVILFALMGILNVISFSAPVKGYFNKIACLDGGRYGYDEVVPVLEMVGEDDGTDTLIIGDSVAAQMFEGLIGKDPDVLICPTNRAVTFAGQYIFVKEYLDAHPDAREVYIVMYTGSLASTIDAQLSYQYVGMPFIIGGYGDDLDDVVMSKLKRNYGSLFLHPQVMNMINNSAMDRVIYLKAVSEIDAHRPFKQEAETVSDITVDYLSRIHDLCSSRGADVYLLSTPLCDTASRRAECDRIREIFAETGLADLYPEYCESFIFMDKEYFLDDETHFKAEYKSREFFNPIIDGMIVRDW